MPAQQDHAGVGQAWIPSGALKRTQCSSQNCPERKSGWRSTTNSCLHWLEASLSWKCVSRLLLWIWTELSCHFRLQGKTRQSWSMFLKARCCQRDSELTRGWSTSAAADTGVGSGDETWGTKASATVTAWARLLQGSVR